MVESILSLLQNNDVPSTSVFGIGIASAGPYDRERNVMLSPPNFMGWHNVPLVQQIEAGCHIPTFFEKESPAIALAEHFFGKHRGHHRIMSVSLYERGIGGGFVVDGNVYHGNSNVSMEIGHIGVDTNGVRCSCGDIGCLEAQADGRAAIRYASEAIDAGADSCLKGESSIDFAALCRAVMRSDPVATAAIERCAHYLGITLTNLLTVLSPDILYLGGPFIRACPPLFPLAVEKIQRKTYPFQLSAIGKETFSFGDISGAMGGVAAAYAAICS